MEAEPVSPTQIAPEQGRDLPGPEMELSSILPALCSPSDSDLVEAIEAGSSTITIRSTSVLDFHFLEAAPLKTHFSRIVPTAATPVIPELSIIFLPQQSPPASIALPPIEVDSQDEFIRELVKGFYRSLRRCLPMIFKSTRTFASWRVIFS